MISFDSTDFTHLWDKFRPCDPSEPGEPVTLSGQVIFKRSCSKSLCFIFLQEMARRSDQGGRLIQLFCCSRELPNTWETCARVRKGDVVVVTGRTQATQATWDRVLGEIAVQSIEIIQPWPFGREADNCFESVQRFSAAEQVPVVKVRDENEHPHAHRARVFVDWLVATYGELRGPVIDVAGGAGDVAFELYRRGIPSVIIDPREVRLTPKLRKQIRSLGYKVNLATGAEWLNKNLPRLACCLDEDLLQTQEQLFQSCSLIVGMHPDQATGCLVEAAVRFGKPFATVPCCIFGHDFPDRFIGDKHVDTHEDLVQWLVNLSGAQTTKLPFEGKNICVFRTMSTSSESV